MEKILLVQFIAHIVADFFAQPECVSRKKGHNGFRSWHLYAHVLIVFTASMLATPSLGFVLWAGAIAVSHMVIDAVKDTVERKSDNKKSIFLFFADQILHFAVLWSVVLFYMKTDGTTPEYYDESLFSIRNLLLVTNLLLCLKPTNILIQTCLSKIKHSAIAASLADESVQATGRWIGSIERLLTFVLVLLGKYEAMGLIIAAKSLRKDNSARDPEYVLIGTLMSFAVAFALGVGITSGFFENVINIISCNI